HEDERILGALRAGAHGYLLKGAGTEAIAGAIRTVYGGGSHLEPSIAARILARARGTPAATPRMTAARLTAHEQEVLRLVAEGQGNKQIARALGIAERTAKFHVTSILRKLEVQNRAQAVSIALQRGLLAGNAE